MVDEVQDLTQAELLLLLEVSTDRNGHFLCGDTAQTISRGVGFRFSDVQALFAASATGTRLDDNGAGAAAEPVNVPPLRSLSCNYRTHDGIVQCAAAIVSLLCQLFPNCIDRLDSEQGHFRGPQPALIPDTDPAAVAESMLGADDIDLTLEFGANQAVLVRNEAAKEKLPAALKAGLVMTVEESKGLEFDDVCIYDFFSDSPASKEWMVLYSKGMQRDEVSESARAREFDDHEHLLLCEELKQLYVALTRARKRCFLFDQSATKREAAFKYLTRIGVAESGLEAQQLALASTAARSTPEEWVHRGENFLQDKMYRQAEKCFLRGGDEAHALYAGGYRKCAEKSWTSCKEGAVCFLAAAAHCNLPAPERVQARKNAAAAYYQAGKRADAVNECEAASELFDHARHVLQQLGLGPANGGLIHDVAWGALVA